MPYNSNLNLQDKEPRAWIPFEKYSKRFRRHADLLQEFQRTLRSFSMNPGQEEQPPTHDKHLRDVETIESSWRENKEDLIPLLLDVPESKRKLLTKYVDTLSDSLPNLRNSSKNAYTKMGSVSSYIKNCVQAFKRISLKLDERARWYRAHPDLRCQNYKS